MTLAEIKRRAQPGKRMRLTYSRNAELWKHESEREKLLAGALDREIALAQKNAIAFRNEAGTLSWLYWPKASLIRPHGDNGFSILFESEADKGTINLTYEFLE